MKAIAAPSLKGRALRWLSMREYTRAELSLRLAPLEEAPGQVQAILDELEKKGFLSDVRAAQSLVYRRQAKLGATRIRQELRNKGVPAELVAERMVELRATEQERARAVWEQKFGAPAIDRNAQMRQMRFLAARGFSAEVVRAVVPAASGLRGNEAEPATGDWG
jgi:regulatory protein